MRIYKMDEYISKLKENIDNISQKIVIYKPNHYTSYCVCSHCDYYRNLCLSRITMNNELFELSK